jgi:polyphosphate kinase 2 (PPK2 family)
MSYALVAVAAATAISAGVSYYNGEQQVSMQKKAIEQTKQNALKQESMADQADNKLNQKKPNAMGILEQAQASGKGGTSGTMLTGAQGVDPNALQLGRNTLLGS